MNRNSIVARNIRVVRSMLKSTHWQSVKEMEAKRVDCHTNKNAICRLLLTLNEQTNKLPFFFAVNKRNCRFFTSLSNGKHRNTSRGTSKSMIWICCKWEFDQKHWGKIEWCAFFELKRIHAKVRKVFTQKIENVWPSNQQRSFHDFFETFLYFLSSINRNDELPSEQTIRQRFWHSHFIDLPRKLNVLFVCFFLAWRVEQCSRGYSREKFGVCNSRYKCVRHLKCKSAIELIKWLQYESHCLEIVYFMMSGSRTTVSIDFN